MILLERLTGSTWIFELRHIFYDSSFTVYFSALHCHLSVKDTVYGAHLLKISIGSSLVVNFLEATQTSFVVYWD